MWPPIVRFTAAFAAGAWTGLVYSPPVGITALVAVAAGVLALLRGWRAGLVAALVAGSLTGAAQAAKRATECPQVWSAGPRAAILRVHDAPGRRGLTSGTIFHAQEGCAGPVRIALDSGSVRSGETLVAVGSFRPNRLFRIEHFRILGAERSWRFAIRDRVARRIADLYGPRAPLVEAMVLGRRTDLDPAVRHTFVAGGIAHLLAISGLHVGLLAGWVILALTAVGKGPSMLFASAALTWMYVALLGFPAPATRAATFVSIGLVSRARQRRPHTSAVVSVSVLVVVAVDPGAVTAIGAWLSVCAVWGAAAATGIVSTGSRYGAALRLVAGSVGATLLTAPITAYAFGNVAPIGVLSNVIAVPLAGLAVPGVFLSLALGSTIAGGAGLALAGIETVGSAAATLPGGHLTGEPGVAFALPWCALLLVALRLAWDRPGRSMVRRRAWGVALVAGWVFVLAPFGALERESGRLEIHVLDVGQGDAIAIRTPRNRWVLVDGGPRVGGWDAGRRVVLPFLRRHGVRELSAVMLSHGDADHLGGLPAVIEAIPPGLVFDPGLPLGTHLYLEFLGSLEAAGAEWQAARGGDVVVVDSVRFEVLHPSTEWAARVLDPNENSVVVRVSYGDFDALLTGDVGWPAESALAPTMDPVEVLKVGHHGSAGGTRGAWLDAVSPLAAVVSVGRRNRYGHPDPAVLERIEERRIPLFRTDIAGTVTIRTDGSYFDIGSDDLNARERLLCLLLTLSQSSGSSSSRSECTRRQPGSSPAFSTKSR